MATTEDLCTQRDNVSWNHYTGDGVVIDKGFHGGTGLTDEQFRKLISLGMRKINIATDIFRAAAMARHTEDIFASITSSSAAVKAVTMKYIALFGSAGKAE